MSKSAPCDQLSELLKSDPSGTNRHAVSDHIASCPVCQKIMEGTVDFHGAATATDQTWKVMDETAAFSHATFRQDTLAAGQLGSPDTLRLPGYEVLGELGRGGMGVVFKARQISLDRLVALKIIRSAAIAGASQLARFTTEAEALAQLQHPNIVQVFDIGQHQDMPYLSMEFVSGPNLASALEQQRYAPREAAAMVEKLARAMFSAHQRGVLHRDLKPSNVLLAADGEPKITDFGLAKRVGSDSQLTVDQTVMGTPSYMPPEQAQGQLAAIGPRSDVYSLGAILYEFLTGRPPFRGSTPLETIRQVIQNEPAAPRTISPRVPRDLETICLKCLHKQPEQRYETAADLADDLRRFQRDEPILARRIGLVGRGWRWCRRNPALSAAILVSCIAVLAGVSGVIWQSRQTQRARSLAQQQFQRYTAESAEKLALIQDLMERVPEEERAQDKRLQSALASYESWLADEPTDESAKTGYADALYHVAEIRRRIGQFKLAEDMGLKARDRYQQLLASAPNDANYRKGMALALVSLGEGYRESGQTLKAVTAYEQAMEFQTAVGGAAKTANPDPEIDASRARSLYNRALAYRELNRGDDAEQDLRQSIQLLQQSLQVRPQEPAFRQSLARAKINLGVLHRAAKRLRNANDEYQGAIDLLAELEKQFPEIADFRFELATVLMNQANLLFDDRTRKELPVENPLQAAETNYRESVDKLRALSNQYSNVPLYQKVLANCLNGLGAVLSEMGQKDKAEQTWSDAVQVLKGLAERSPKVAEFYALMAQTNRNLAFLHQEDPEPIQFEKFLRAAVVGQRQATALSPDNVLYSRALRIYESRLSRLLVSGGKHVEAADVAEQLASHSANDGAMQYAAAKVLAQCAVVAEKDASLDASHRDEKVSQYRNRATALVAECRKQNVPLDPADLPGIKLD